MRYRFIDAEKAGTLTVESLANALEVSRSGYYAWKARQERAPTERERQTETLRELVREIHATSRGTYGRPRIQAVLRSRGYRVGANRLRRVMCQEAICGRKQRRWRHHSETTTPPSTNLVERNFKTERPNQVWCGDITEYSVGGIKIFLAVVIDLYARRVVGLAFGRRATSALAVKALIDALDRRTQTRGVIFHTDRGIQYRAKLFRLLASANGVVQSMSRAYNCLDNAVAESFFATLEHELASRTKWTSPEEAEADIREFILDFYNPIRLHSSNDNLSPEAFETQAA